MQTPYWRFWSLSDQVCDINIMIKDVMMIYSQNESENLSVVMQMNRKVCVLYYWGLKGEVKHQVLNAFQRFYCRDMALDYCFHVSNLWVLPVALVCKIHTKATAYTEGKKKKRKNFEDTEAREWAKALVVEFSFDEEQCRTNSNHSWTALRA